MCVRVCPCVGRAGPIRFASVSISQEHAGQQGGPRASTGAGGHSRRPGPSPLLSLPSGRSTSRPRSSLSPQEQKRLLGRFPLAPDLPPTRHCPAKRHTWFRHHRVTGLKGPPLGVHPSAGKRQENSVCLSWTGAPAPSSPGAQDGIWQPNTQIQPAERKELASPQGSSRKQPAQPGFPPCPEQAGLGQGAQRREPTCQVDQERKALCPKERDAGCQSLRAPPLGAQHLCWDLCHTGRPHPSADTTSK